MCICKYACFRGRASRSEFWCWMLFVAVVAGLLFGVAATLVAIRSAAGPETPDNPLNWLSQIIFPVMVLLGVFLLFCLLPTIAIAVRRLRDTGNRPWLIGIPIAFLVGSYHPLLDLALSGMSPDQPTDIPFPLSYIYLTVTMGICLYFVCLLTKKSIF